MRNAEHNPEWKSDPPLPSPPFASILEPLLALRCFLRIWGVLESILAAATPATEELRSVKPSYATKKKLLA